MGWIDVARSPRRLQQRRRSKKGKEKGTAQIGCQCADQRTSTAGSAERFVRCHNVAAALATTRCLCPARARARPTARWPICVCGGGTRTTDAQDATDGRKKEWTDGRTDGRTVGVKLAAASFRHCSTTRSSQPILVLLSRQALRLSCTISTICNTKIAPFGWWRESRRRS